MLISTAISVVQKGMRVIAISEEQGTSKQQLLDAHHRLRAKVFSGRLGWEVAVTDGRETDAFDALQPDYILALSTSGEVAGCAGLLPALGAIASAKREVGRPPFHGRELAFLRRRCPGGGKRGVPGATRRHHRVVRGQCYIEIATVTDLRFERLLARVGWPLHRLDGPISETMAVAGIVHQCRSSVLLDTVLNCHPSR